MFNQQERRFIIIVYVFLLLTLFIFELTQIDLAIADAIYQFEGGQWLYKKDFFFNTIMHDGVRTLFKAIAVLLLFKLIYTYCFASRCHFIATTYLITCLIVTSMTVAILKKLTDVGCPWHYTRYGGEHIYQSISQSILSKQTDLACFPAGHASGGYAFVCLYFYCLLLYPKYRWIGLTTGLIFGLTLDLVQQFRGAHFSSHGLWTLGIAWLVAYTSYLMIKKVKLNNNVSSPI